MSPLLMCVTLSVAQSIIEAGASANNPNDFSKLGDLVYQS
tara:strand:- start:219 stop:338 length:120 start_codon:yes stop_codon:yes gene_type:complete